MAAVEERAEVPLEGGFVNDVVRVGDTVRRTAGPWTPTIHALLDHLERVGFTEAPQVLGLDDRGREILTFLPGATMPWTDWPAFMLGLDGPKALGEFLRRYHDAVRSFRPAPDAVWRNPLAPATGELIRHGDFSPFNVVWQDDRPTGLIDWDFAQPGRAIHDLGYLAWQLVPLQPDDRAREYGYAGEVDRAARLRALCAAYGEHVAPDEVVDAAIEAILVERDQTARLAERGLHPWVGFAGDGNLDAFLANAEWIRAHRGAWT